jgi:hypothetical protein
MTERAPPPGTLRAVRPDGGYAAWRMTSQPIR